MLLCEAAVTHSHYCIVVHSMNAHHVFIHPTANEHLSCSQVGAIMNSVINIYVHEFG